MEEVAAGAIGVLAACRHGHACISATRTGDFYALDARNGKTIWQTQLSGSVKAAPAFADGTLYVGDYAGQMYAIRASDGAIRWQTSDLGTGLSSGRFYSTPAVAFGRVYAGNVDGRVYSFDRQTGEIDWTFSAGDYVYSGVAAADGDKIKPSVYFGSHDRQRLLRRRADGQAQLEGGARRSGERPGDGVGDVVYVSTFSGNATLGFDLETGRRVFKVDDGEYGPAVSDGVHLFIAGGSDVIAYKPIKIGDYKAKEGEKGIVPPAERRKAHGQQPGPRRQAAGEEAEGEPQQGGQGQVRGRQEEAEEEAARSRPKSKGPPSRSRPSSSRRRRRRRRRRRTDRQPAVTGLTAIPASASACFASAIE